MNPKKTAIKDCYERLGISKATLYSRLKKLDIKPLKVGKNSYLSSKDLDRLDKYSPTKDKQDKQNKELEKLLEKKNEEIKLLKETSEKQSGKIENLNREVGQWQGRAKTLEEQNEKLLVLEAPKKQKEKRGFFKSLFNL